MSRFLLCLALAGLSYAQPLPRRGEYALILKDPPVAQATRTRAELAAPAAQARLQAVRQAQAPAIAELKRRNVSLTYASQILVNALFVNTTRETAAQLRGIPGVLRVQYLPPVQRDLNTALALENVPAAWNAVGGAANAGAGVKIGIIDSGIDQNHPGFQAPSLKPPANFPKGDSGYTNNKVIVARSYVSLLADYWHEPDDLTPRDHSGHGTAIAMIAAGVQNTGPVAAIQGVAPGAFLGNYKIFGSPGVNDFTLVSAITQALTDAVSDGMDIVTLSINEGDPAQSGPLDYNPDPNICGGNCDVRTQAVETAVQSGLVVVTSAGNSNGSGVQPITLGSIHTPGTAPSAITVGSTTNSHLLLQSVHISGGTVPANLQNIHALFSDGPHFVPPAAPVKDVAQTGDDGLACSAIPASLAGTIALVQRGTCLLSVKVNNAQAAGALGVIIYQSPGFDTVYSAWGAQNTGIPAMMISASDGAALKSYVNGNSGVTAAFDPALTAVGATQNKMSTFSSRGPSLGMFSSSQVCAAGAQCPVLALKPELVAVGDGVYTATQKFDPNGDAYNATGYTGVSGTSYAVPMVAGAVAIVKQKYPGLTPAQLKSAVVNSATQDVVDIDSSQARVTAMGAGKLSAGDAVNVAATLEPATLGFGVISQASLPARLSLKITNVSSATATFSLAIQPRDTSSATVVLSASTVTLQPGQFNVLSVALQGTQPAAGSYEGFIAVSGAGTLHVPYQYQVLAATRTAYDMFPISGASFLAGTGDNEANNAAAFVAFRLVDQWGAPIIGTPVTFNIASGSATFGQFKDAQTFNYGIAGTDLNIGNDPGDIVVNASAGGLNYTFFGYARPHPSINNNGVVDDATGAVGQGLAPGSYITIYGNALADATQRYSTPFLPLSLSSDSVSFDGGGLRLPGHLHFVSPGQINVQIPWEFQGQKSVQMTVWSNYLSSASYTVPLASYSPGFFANSGNAAVIDQTSASIVTASNPAKRGDILQLYVNGLGPVSNTPASGDPAVGGSQLSQTTQLPTVTLGATNLPVSFAGLAPGFIGLYQVNVTIPANAPTGNQPLVITLGGVSSPSANLPVQ